MVQHKVIIAMDSFKGNASSKQLGSWVATGIKNVAQDAIPYVLSIADGGEGTLDALVAGCDGEIIEQEVQGPLAEEVQARYGMLDEHTAVIEMAEASGIILTKQNEEDALSATTYGVGELMIAAMDQGATKLFIGLGGSATTDGGVGMAQALGVKFLDESGSEISPGASGLPAIAQIDSTALDPRIKDLEIQILSDVNNPLTGEKGAAAVYGPQKGIPKERIEEIDAWLCHYGKILERDQKAEVAQKPGAGAAGGLGAGLFAFTKASFGQGIDEILDLLHFDDCLQKSSLVITGEGRIDNQSVHGKAPIGIAKRAKKYDLPVVAIVGNRDADLSEIYQNGIDLVLSNIPRPMSLEEAIKEVKENTILAGETAMRAFLLNNKTTKEG